MLSILSYGEENKSTKKHDTGEYLSGSKLSLK